jgi:hypothetical protein
MCLAKKLISWLGAEKLSEAYFAENGKVRAFGNSH